MKNQMNINQIKKIIFLLSIIILFINIVSHAQISDPGTGGTSVNGDPNGDAPIDGGLSLLIAAGVGYGVKRVKNRRVVKKDLDNKS